MNKKNLFIFLAIVLLLLFSSATIMVYAESGITEQVAELYKYTVEQDTEVSITSDDGATQQIMLVAGNEYLFRNEDEQCFLDYIYMNSSLDDTVLTIKSMTVLKSELGAESTESTIYKIPQGMSIRLPESVGLHLTIPENQTLTCYKDEDGAYTYLSDGKSLVKERLAVQDRIEDPSILNTYIKVEENCDFEGVTIKENTLIPITNFTTSEFNGHYQFIYLAPIKSEGHITYVTKKRTVPTAYCSVVLFSREDRVSVIDIAEENELIILGERIEIDAQDKFYYLDRNGEILLPILSDKTISNVLPTTLPKVPTIDTTQEPKATSAQQGLKLEIEHLIFILLCILLLLMIWQIVLLYHVKKNKKTPEQESMKQNVEFIVDKVMDKAKIGADVDSVTADGFRLLDKKIAVIEKLLRRKVDLTSPAASHQMPIIKLTPVSIVKVKLHSYDINISQERGIISVREDKEIIFENTKKLSPYQIETYNLNYVFDFLSGMPEQTNKAILFDVEKSPRVELRETNYILKEKGTISFK